MFQMLPPRLAFSTRFSCGGGGGGAVVVSGERLAVDARRNDPDEMKNEAEIVPSSCKLVKRCALLFRNQLRRIRAKVEEWIQ
ncbi:Os08g0503300 [Oryza sativa Japonica Group]|uniref:Os08g0503300 protein n=1 Tax=Oryza sativa subsp. japonica TaxID=39947 RepID=A0A0P0XII9_ORYSJ|nr:hypothetical protein EE612_045200 [Oryza sativa]BAT06135.1 Os08g0503300 [Oryza sativa Japonica Group]